MYRWPQALPESNSPGTRSKPGKTQKVMASRCEQTNLLKVSSVLRPVCVCVHICVAVGARVLCDCMCMYTMCMCVLYVCIILPCICMCMHLCTGACVYTYMYACVCARSVQTRHSSHPQGLLRRGNGEGTKPRQITVTQNKPWTEHTWSYQGAFRQRSSKLSLGAAVHFP